MNDKFVYKSENEFQLVDSQCELCVHYNEGKYSDICPTGKIEDIRNNLSKCPMKHQKSIFE